MNIPPTFYNPRTAGRRRAAFSLVEITLALGIVTFALVGVVGVLPVAMASSRQSVDKNRAAAIAGTLFTSFRSQTFYSVCYLDNQFDDQGRPVAGPTYPLDLNASVQADPSSGAVGAEVKFYATFLDGSTPANVAVTSFARQRHLRLASTASGGADFVVKMRFNNHPEGAMIDPNNPTAVTPTYAPHGRPAQLNQVEVLISPISRPQDQYRFISIVANRTN